MTPSRRTRLISLIAPCALLVVACDDDGGGGGSTEAFCGIMEEQESIELTDDEDPSDVIEALVRLKDAAPADIRGDVDAAVDGFTELIEIDFENLSEDDFAELEERFSAATEASERVERWAIENCDLPADFFE